MKKKLEELLYVAVFVFMIAKETVLHTPWMMFALGIASAFGLGLFLYIL